jgi:hypothetical protein
MRRQARWTGAGLAERKGGRDVTTSEFPEIRYFPAQENGLQWETTGRISQNWSFSYAGKL